MPDQTAADRLISERYAASGPFAKVLDQIFVNPPRAEPVTWASIASAMEALNALPPPPPARELHCGPAVWDTLRELKPTDTGPIGLGAALGGQSLYGVPVRVDHTMAAGRWEMREGEEVVGSGDITPDFDGPVFYLSPGRWIGLKLRTSDLLELDSNTTRPGGEA